MKRSAALITLLAMLVGIYGCSGSARNEVSSSIPGLTAKEVDLLNGVWEQMNLKDVQAAAEQWKSTEKFNWGSGKITQTSVLVDLNANPPYIAILGLAKLEVLGAEKKGANYYIIKTRRLGSAVPGHPEASPIDHLDIVIQADGTMSFVESIGRDIKITDPEGFHFFRTYGPGITQ